MRFPEEGEGGNGCRDGNATYDETAVEADAGGVVGKMEIVHELVHIGKELGERDWFYHSDGAEGCELALWDGGGRGLCQYLGLDVLVMEEGTGLVCTGRRHWEGKNSALGYLLASGKV